jgi:hypothetical protein
VLRDAKAATQQPAACRDELLATTRLGFDSDDQHGSLAMPR